MKTSQSKVSKKENRRRAGVKVKKLRRAQSLGRGSATTAEEKLIITTAGAINKYYDDDHGLKLSDLLIEDLKDNEDLWLHLGATASLYAEAQRGSANSSTRC